MVLTTLSAGAAFVVLMLSWPPLAVAHRFIGETYKNHKGEVFKALDIVDYEQFYYYHSIHGKMAESLSVSQCTIGGGIKDWDGYSPTRGHDADIEVNMHPPGKIVFNQWRSLKYALSETPTKHATQRQFVQVSPSLCISKEFKYYSNGNFKRAKGCLKMVTKDKNTGRETKVVNTYGATLHPDHARCNHEAAVKTCVTSTKHATDYPVEIENETPIANEAYPFLLTAKDVIVAKSGMFALPCGPVGLYSSCEATNWGLPSARNHTADAAKCRHADETHGEHMTEQAGALKGALHLEDCPHTVYEKVFAMCQYDDTQIGQFVLEALPKLVYHLDMLYANPDMKIHYGFTKRAVLPSFVLPHTIFQWLGLSDRLINGTFYAKEAYMPRECGCQEPGYNMWEIYHMRETFKNRAIKEIGTGGRNNSAGWAFPTAASFDGKVAGGETDLGPMDYQSNEGDVDKPVVILVKRGASKFTQNQGDHKIRRWPPELGGAAAVRACTCICACVCVSVCVVWVSLCCYLLLNTNPPSPHNIFLIVHFRFATL